MASYIQGLTDIAPPVTPFQPDFGMVQKALSTLQSRYEQGFASVKNAYSQVLQAPITNLQLKQERDVYVKHAEQQLRNLASVDLSLPENVSAAEGVFSPFWQDDKMLTDMHLTKTMQREIQKGYAARDSTDDKVREQYNDLSIRYLQNGLEALQTADPNSPEFAKMQARRWVPFKNLEKYLSEQADAQKLEIKWTSPSGPYLIETKNGERSLTPFKTWAHNMLGNNFSEQFRVMGTVENEEGVKQILTNNPTLTKDQALKEMANQTMRTLEKGYTDQGKELDDSLRKVDAKINWYLNRNLSEDTDKEDIAELKSLQQQKDALEQQKTGLGEQQTLFSQNKDKMAELIRQNPEQYFAQANKQRVVDGWAAARASMVSTDVKINPLLKEQNDANYQNEMLKYHWAEYGLKERQFEAKFVDTDGDGEPDTYVGNKGGGSGGSGSGGGGKKAGVDETAASGLRVGYGITDVSRTGSAWDVMVREQTNRLHQANNSFFSLEGVARVLKTKLGFDDIEVRDYVSELLRKYNDPEGYDLKKHVKGEHLEKFDKITAALEKESHIKITGREELRNAMVTVATDYLKEKLKDGGKNMAPEDRIMLKRYMEGMNSLQVYAATERNKQEATDKLLGSTKKFDLLKKTGSDGKNSIIGVDDLAKGFKQTYTLIDKDGESKVKFTPEMLAQMYAEGKLEITTAGDRFGISVNGKKYYQPKSELSPDTPSVVRDTKDLIKKYGWSEDFKVLRDQLNKEIGPLIPEFQNKTGRMGVRMKYNLRSDVDNEFSYRLLSDLQNPDNRLAIYDGQERSEDEDVNNAVLRLLSQGETAMEKYISAIHLDTLGPNGNPMVEFSVIPLKETDKTVLGDIDLTALNNKTIRVELNPAGSGSTLQSIRFNPGFYMFGDILKGKEYRSDPMLEAAGFKFRVLPNDKYDPQYVTVTLERTVFDERTGQNKPLKKFERRVDLGDRPPDDVMGMVYDFLDKHLADNEEANERYSARTSGKSRTGQEWLTYWKENRPPG